MMATDKPNIVHDKGRCSMINCQLFMGHTDGSGGSGKVSRVAQECVQAWRALGRPDGAKFTESVLGGCGHNGHLEARVAAACEVVGLAGGLIHG